MKSKIISMFLLTVICSLAIVSASANFTVTTSTPVDLTKNLVSTSFLITPNGPVNQSVNIAVNIPTKISDSKASELPLNPPFIFNFQNVPFGTAQGPIQISYTGTVPTNYQIGRFTANANITVTDAANPTNTLTQTVPISFVNDFCTNGENGTDLSISSVEINNNDGDDTDWVPLDSISVKVEVSNDGTEKISSVAAEIGIYDITGKNVVSKLDGLANKKIKLSSINDGDSKTADFKFNVPVDFKEEEYRLVVKAYSDNKGQKNLCTAHSSDLDNNYYQLISGSRETDEGKHIILNNIVLSPETSAQCGEKVQVSAEAVNIGDTDYEDQVKVTIYNKELNINKEEILNENFDQGDSSAINFEFDIPETAAEKTYTLEFRTYYDFDSSDDSYSISSDEKFTKTFKVEGNCKPATPITPTTKPPVISAELDSETPEAIAGNQVIIKTTVKNNGDKEAVYSLSVLDNSAWSDVESIEPKVLTVSAGLSKEASIVLNLNKDAAGDKEFLIRATYGENNEQTSQKVALTITKQSGADLGPIAQHFRENWFIYVIVLINVILIIAIIVVIRRMMRPRVAVM